MKVVFIHGNGNASAQDNWFPSVKNDLEKHGLQVISKDFPNPNTAKESDWIPFLKHTIQTDEHTILVGHSSGAIAAMRYAEQYPIFGSVLVGAYYTDLGMEQERLSGYFSRDWHWDTIAQNQKFISLFASQDDPWIPIDQPRYLHKKLNCEYHEYTDQGHFGGDYFKETFPELTLSLIANIKKVTLN